MFLTYASARTCRFLGYSDNFSFDPEFPPRPSFRPPTRPGGSIGGGVRSQFRFPAPGLIGNCNLASFDLTLVSSSRQLRSLAPSPASLRTLVAVSLDFTFFARSLLFGQVSFLTMSLAVLLSASLHESLGFFLRSSEGVALPSGDFCAYITWKPPFDLSIRFLPAAPGVLRAPPSF